MPVQADRFNFFSDIDLMIFVKIFFIVFVIFYLVFSLMMYRQVQIMTAKLPTPMSPLLRFVAIMHIGVAAAVLLFVIGVF